MSVNHILRLMPSTKS